MTDRVRLSVQVEVEGFETESEARLWFIRMMKENRRVTGMEFVGWPSDGGDETERGVSRTGDAGVTTTLVGQRQPIEDLVEELYRDGVRVGR